MNNQKRYPTDPKLIESIIEHRTTHNLTNAKLGKILGVSETFLSKYLNDNLDRPPKNFVAETRDALKSIKRRIELSTEIFETSVTKNIRGRINYIRETGDIGLITSPAGHGKTSSIWKYAEENPSSIVASFNARSREARPVEGIVFSAIENRAWKGCSSRFNYLVSHLKGTHRPLLLDNCQRLLGDGLDWIFDFYDATGCPTIMFGNPETVDRIKNSDQRSSRLGLVKEVRLQNAEIAKHSKRVAIQFSDEKTANEIADLVAVIGKHDGYLRSVRKEVMLMQAIRRNNASVKDDPRTALRMAHTELARNYSLPA